MIETGWSFAPLDEQELALVEVAEHTLGTAIVIVFEPGDPRRSNVALPEMKPASLDASQIEWLQGLEARIGATAVAYAPA